MKNHAKNHRESRNPPKIEGVVVGIGASAGGLEALKEFFTAMPADTGMAFIIVQHLEPTHESRTAEILAKTTAMKVVQVEDGMTVEPNTVFTNPPGRALSIREGRLVLAPASGGQRVAAAIDRFLISLAEDQDSRAVAVILSGSSGQDGLHGIRAIRGGGGMCMAQDPATAQFPEMPQMAIDTGLIDYVLPPGQMPEALVQFAASPQVSRTESETASHDQAEALEFIIDLVRTGTKRDYRHYKRSTLVRRIQRRMGLCQINQMDEYLQHLQENPDELIRLGKDMLIGVSSFFRDANAFEELRGVMDATIGDPKRDPETPLRAWVAGCATGEEAYSIAMLLLEVVSRARTDGRVQVFASDLDEEALEVARAGIYPETIVDDVSPERLQRFFTKQGQDYRVDTSLREALVFSRHNLLNDPPFSRLDLISCRNVLIYLEPAAHKKILTMFTFALNQSGHLFLGKSEGTSGLDDYFASVSPQSRIYRLTRSNRRGAAEFALRTGLAPRQSVERERTQFQAAALSLANQEALLQQFNASAVIIDRQGKILYFYGQTERYLGQPKGIASFNILDLTFGALSARLRRGIEHAALQHEQPFVFTAPARPGEGTKSARVTVKRLAEPIAAEDVLAVIFEDVEPLNISEKLAHVPVDDEPLMAQMEAEIKSLRQQLQTNAREYDTANEELKTASEEVMSMNEELLSANEELEASKEELQSLNEELTTVNTQLNETVNDLTTTNNDLSNLIAATEIATVFLDAQLRIKRFTPSATYLLNLIESDIGRPVSHITQNFSDVDLMADAQGALRDLVPREREVQTTDGRWFTLRILPYRTQDNRIDGAVITFADVTRLKQTELNLEYEKTYAEDIVETVRHPLVVLDHDMRLLSANPAFYLMFRVDPALGEKQRFYDLFQRQLDNPGLRRLLEEVIPGTAEFEEYQLEHDFPEIGSRILLINGRRIRTDRDLPERILISIEDITDREKARQSLEAFNAELEQKVAERTSLAEHRLRLLREATIQTIQSEQRERERLACVLHDNLQQLLIGAKFPLRTILNHTHDDQLLNAAQSIEELLNQMLETSRSLTSDLSPSILYEAGLDEALPWLARRMKAEHGIEVSTRINAKIGLDDEGVVILLFQATRELLLNVVKHAGVDMAHVQLDQLDEGLVRIIVRDEGVGFDPGTPNALLTRGSGLGLFGWRERLQHIGGDCEVFSRPGEGARITLTVPITHTARKARVGASTTGIERTPDQETASTTGKIRVLLVDDHKIVRQGLAGILSQEPDIEIVGEAGDGEYAVDMAHLLRPDIVIIDVVMPGMNGIEATRIITAELPETRVIGLSMYIEADRAEAMREAGALEYLAKGGSSDELLAAVRRCYAPK